jgi:tetratricopeptide (TPR) repeat protein
VDALERTEDPEHENRALEVLEEAHRRTGQFRFRQRIGRIKMRQMNRMARSMRDHLGADHADYRQFVREQLEFELAEFKLWSENYPTDMGLRYEVGRRLFALARYEESIPVLQQARQDPKFRFESALLLGRCFMESSFIAEAVDTLGNAISDYQLRGNDLSKELHYWLGRALEVRGDREAAGKQFSTVAQWEWNYRDVQTRLRAMRAGEAAAR